MYEVIENRDDDYSKFDDKLSGNSNASGDTD
jgi:hypothetical protein